MHCCVADLRNKDVVNKRNGVRLGNVIDVQVDTCTGCVVALLVAGGMRGGFFAREECFVRWEDVEVIGDDIILVNHTPVPTPTEHRKGVFEKWFR